MPGFVCLLLTLAAQGPFGEAAFKDESNRILVAARAPSGVELQVQPSSGKPQARVWRKEEVFDGQSLSFSMMAAMPDALPENRKTIRDEINRREKEFEKEGGRTMTIERGSYKVRLTARFGYAGTVVLHESAQSPVLYYRTIIAEKGLTERAKTMLTGLGITDGTQLGVSMYDRGFPSGWTYDFAGTRVKVPYPAQWESLPSDPGEDGFTGTVRYSTYDITKDSSWGMTERITQTQESIIELAKRPLPRAVDYSPNVRILSVDSVDWQGEKMIRQRGLYGNGEFERDWMSLTFRDRFWRLHTVFLKKDKKASWPVTPFPINATGTPLKEGDWKKPPGRYDRIFDLGEGAKFTFTAYGIGEPTEVDGTYTIVNSPGEATTLRVRNVGAKARDEWVLPTGAYVPKKLADLNARVVDLHWKREAASWWLKARYLVQAANGTDQFQLVEFVGTEQGGQTFVLTQAGLDTESSRNTFRDVVVSCKGADGRPLFSGYPEGQAGSEYVLPYHKFRMGLTGLSNVAAISLGDGNVLLGGYLLADQAKIFHSIEINKWGGVPHLQRVFRSVFGSQDLSRPKEVKFKQGSSEVKSERRSCKTQEGIEAFVTTFSNGNGVYTHVLQAKDKPEEGWLKHLGYSKP